MDSKRVLFISQEIHPYLPENSVSIATVLNAIGRLAAKTESKVDDEILSALTIPIGRSVG